VKVPLGFQFSGVNAGIKSARKDLALVFSRAPCAAAGCFTINKARAAPILDAEKRLPASGMHAVLINSGNANALTGEEGLADVSTVVSAAATALGVSPQSIVTASTGIIGHRLPVAKVTAALPTLCSNLSHLPDAAAEAILTTDTRVKMSSRSIRLGSKDVTLSIIGKGSGMIAPSLATMIVVLVTDCDIAPHALSLALSGAMARSFNCLTVDGDMSTNDAVFALANGLAGNTRIEAQDEAWATFAAAVDELCKQMAKEIAADGEGATRLLEVTIEGAPSEAMAQDLARAVTGSSLVKTAIFGADPNWGRILASVGARAGTQNYALEPAASTVHMQGTLVYDRGPVSHDLTSLRLKLREPEVSVTVNLNAGPASATAWGCDLSYDYVKINADYSSLLVTSPEGMVSKDDRLTNYTPKLKSALLVEALSYISKFTGQRCVVKYGGAAMVQQALKASFCQDIQLLRSVGLQPIVVHGGGPEISKTLERMGNKAEFVDGLRMTSNSDLKVVEMVLTGSINTELVTQLNQHGTHAVGVSGKDGGLLRARKLLGENGRDLGQVGEVTRVNADFLEMLLKQGYLPVISPVGLGEDGATYNVNADSVAAEVALSVKASKLIYLSDVPGVMKEGELQSELMVSDLEHQLLDGSVTGGMRVKVQSMLTALRGGIDKVHLIDGRQPHSLIAELFTDKGIGTLVRR
jgi:acetylglutamate kinase